MKGNQILFYFKGLIVMACGIGLSAHAQVAACRINQTHTVFGQTIISDQCLQNNGLDPAEFKKLCDFGKEGIPELGMAPSKPVYLAACPPQAKSACENFGQGKYSSYVYGKDNVAEPADRKIGCEKLGGKFR